MDRKMLRDGQWERIEQLLPGKANDRGVTAKDIGALSKPFYVPCAPAVLGAICLPSLDIGTGRMCGFLAGARRGGERVAQALQSVRTWIRL